MGMWVNPEQNLIHINFDEILEIAQKGIRRTALFLAIGTNASKDVSHDDLKLESKFVMHLYPYASDKETLNQYGESFAQWVTANALRELTETFSVFLDEFYLTCYFIVNRGEDGFNVDFEKRKKIIINSSPYFKVQALYSDFGFELDFVKSLSTLHTARNCLSHSQGIVREKHLNEDGRFTVRWKAMGAFLKEPNKEEYELPLHGSFDPIHLPEGGESYAKIVGREKHFQEGQVIHFEEHELHEICWTFIMATKNTAAQISNFAERYNLKLNEKDTSTPPHRRP